MIRYRAGWVLPISGPPVRDGWVAVESGRIAAVGSGDAPDALDLQGAAVLPALVNAHTHLELSYLRGQVPPAERFNDWIRTLMAARRAFADPADPTIVSAARVAIEEARAAGTGLFGDISNTLITVPLLREAGVGAQVFYELLGFNAADPDGRVAKARAAIAQAGADERDVRISVAPHAPYSVSPGLFEAIRKELDGHPRPVSSVHLGESVEEVEFLRQGTGAMRALIQDVGAWNEAWKAPGVSSVGYLESLGFLDRRVLVVHGVQFDGEDLKRLADRGVTVVSCPRSNRHVGAGDPPLEAFYAMGVDVAFGTDSLASVEDLDMFAELRVARALAPRVPARSLLASATICGAQALGFGEEFGSIEEGKRAALIAVDVPGGTTDVEEYLVSGVQPDAVQWLDASTPNSQFPIPR